MTLPPGFAPARVLVIRPRGLGDVVLSSVVLDALKRAWPETTIDYLSEKPSGDLLRADPRLDRIYLFGPRSRDDRVTGGGFADAVRWMHRARPDLVLDLFSNPHTALLTAFSGGRYRVGLDKRIRRLVYNVRVPRFRGDPASDHRYAQDVQCDFLRAAGVSWPGKARAGVTLSPLETGFADGALAALGYRPEARWGALLPGGSWESKRWSVEGFVETGRVLAEILGAPALVLWGPPERGDAEAISEALGTAGRLAPPTTLRQMTALVARAAVLVSPDCLGRHLAVIQQVPTVGVFATTDPRDWTPGEGPHRTVSGGKDQGYASLSDLPSGPVTEAVRDLLREVDSDRNGA